ncbi:nicotinic acid phosphoribosyltransferase [Methanococcus maripaludis]|uniref:Nicotinamide phosphoribosyltransferase n=1 Tax=Methanococcus maripaludis TaxID=39152 RepID=A0A7J9NX52_METMI|nr:nicotinic acid phosphoribosyltransferase [Methanococcus maripaludis]
MESYKVKNFIKAIAEKLLPGLVDSYKFTHFLGYPPDTEYVYLYMMARPNSEMTKSEQVVFFGLQYYIKEYLEGVVVTHEMIDELAPMIRAYGYPQFNEEGWRYIVDNHGGKLPVEIKAVPEGSYVNRGNVLMSIVNTDPKCYWLPSYLETLLLEMWYTCTVATHAKELRSLIEPYVQESCDDLFDINFKVHNFGARAGPAPEATRLAGMAHLTSFVGTDTFDSVYAAKKYYNEDNAGISISAAEHSTITSWGTGKANETAAYANMLDKFGHEPLFACVSDSYDYEYAVEHI